VIAEILKQTAEKMERAVEAAKEDFSTIRTGRANPALFQKIIVDYYGTGTPLGNLASIQVLEARSLAITPYDKGALLNVEKAIRDMPNLGAQPNNDGTVIRVTLPDLTEDRRKEYVKLAKTKAEDHRVVIRNVRSKGNDDLSALKKDGLAGEDDISRAEKELDNLTKLNVDAIDTALKHKEAELLEV
jgi:ribosome recycling factor